MAPTSGPLHLSATYLVHVEEDDPYVVQFAKIITTVRQIRREARAKIRIPATDVRQRWHVSTRRSIFDPPGTVYITYQIRLVLP